MPANGTLPDVKATLNGKTLTIPDIRNINLTTGGLFFDFAYLITQQENNSNEGYYSFTFDYLVDNKAEHAEFGFYLINNTSYTANNNFEILWNMQWKMIVYLCILDIAF